MLSLSRVTGWIETLLVVVILFIAFETIIQPILVSIDPMFADQSVPASEISGRNPETPAGWALLTTVVLGSLVYYLSKMVVRNGLDETLIVVGGIVFIVIYKITPERFHDRIWDIIPSIFLPDD